MQEEHPAATHRRVLICRSNPIAPDPRVEKEARSLNKAGYQVQALGWDRSRELPKRSEMGWAVIHRRSIRAAYARGLMNFFPLIFWQIDLLGWLLRHQAEFDVLHACDFDTVLPAIVCSKLFKKKLVYDIFDFYADHLRNTPASVKRIIRAVDLWAIGQADGLILVDDSRIEQIKGAKPERLIVIYNSPEDAPHQASTNPTEGAPIQIAYIGLLQFERGLLELVEVVRRHPEWKLDLAGFGGDEAPILDAIRGLSNVHWHGRVPYSQALALSAQANVLVALYDPRIPNHRYASPNKVFEAMMLGKPIIVARNTNMDRLIEFAGAGLVVEYGDVDNLEIALQRLENDPGLRKALGRAARRAYEEQYHWDVMEKRLVELYNSLFAEI